MKSIKEMKFDENDVVLTEDQSQNLHGKSEAKR